MQLRLKWKLFEKEPRMTNSRRPATAGLLLAAVFITITVNSFSQDEDSGSTVPQLVEKLGDESSEVRERAMSELWRRGKAILRELRPELEKARDPEVRNRLETLIREMTRPRIELVERHASDEDIWISKAVWSPDGRRLVLMEGEQFQVWTHENGWKKTVCIKSASWEQHFVDVAFAPSGNEIAAVRNHPADGERGHTVDFFRSGENRSYASFSVKGKDARKAIFISEDHLAIQRQKAFGMRSSELVIIIRGDEDKWTECGSILKADGDAFEIPVRDFAVSSDRRRLAVLSTGVGTEIERKLSTFVTDATMSTGWRSLGTADLPNELPAGRARCKIDGLDPYAFSSDLRFLAGPRMTEVGELILIDTKAGEITCVPAAYASGQCFDIVGIRYLLAGAENRVFVWDLMENKEVASAKIDGWPKLIMARPDGKEFLVGAGPDPEAPGFLKILYLFRINHGE
jgi:hypothetical protein